VLSAVMEQVTDQFQKTVDSMLIRHQSILDILTKSQESSARINRAVAKSVTSCGCHAIHARKKNIPDNAGIVDLKEILDSQLEGTMCSSCHEILEAELGKHLFYLAALANTLNISLTDVLVKENDKLNTLTIFNMT